MKHIISAALAALMLLSAAGCGTPVPDTATAATASAAEQVLIDRLGGIPENVVLGDASVAAEYGIDMTDFESDGYLLRTVGENTLVFGKTADGLDRAVRAYAKAVEAGNADTLDVVYHEGYRVERLTIAGRDISEYTVYYPETANENMKFAADELVRLVEKATGVKLPVVIGAPVSPAIELRHTDDPVLETDGYRYSVTEDGVIIEGAVERGCMNGVWRFLQWELGWDHLIYGDSYLNEAEHINIPVGTERSEDPAFEYLFLWSRDCHYKNDTRQPSAIENSYGTITIASHAMFNYYDERYYDRDYSLQPCWTSEDFYEETSYNIENLIAANYGRPDFFEVNLGQNDTDEFCYCDTCVEVFNEEGSHSGAIVRYTNRLSEEMGEKYPGLYYKIYAYQSTSKPPKKTVPNEWVHVSFCFDWNCANHKVDGSECTEVMPVMNRTNSELAENFEGWCELTDNIYVYYYALGTVLQHFSVLDNIYFDYHYFYKAGVKGVLLECTDYMDLGIKRIELPLVAELNWNMDMTEEEFEEMYYKLLERHFGDGWVYIRDYINELHRAQDLESCWQGWGWGSNLLGCWLNQRYNIGHYRTRFDYFVELFEAAEYCANSDEQVIAVKKYACPMLYMGCYASYFFEYLEGDTERVDILSERYDRCMNFIRSLGFEPTFLQPYPGALTHDIYYGATLEEAAWRDWKTYYEDITGHLSLPENAPKY